MNPFDQAWALLKEEEVRYHPEDEPMSVEDMESYLNTTELGEIVNAPKSLPTSGDTRKDRMKQTRVMGQTYRGKPTFNLMPLAGENRAMVNPNAEIFRRSEPMELAFQLLKAADSVGFGETPDYQLLPGQMTLDQFPYEGMVDDITHIRSVDPKWFNTMALGGASPLQQARDNQIFEERLPQMESRKLDQIYDRFFFDEPGMQRYLRDKHVPYKQLDTSTPATWWTKPSVENIGRSYIGEPQRMEDRMLVGVRGDLDDMRTQQRDAIQAPESLPEKMVHDTIPPEKLVFIQPSAEDMELPHGMESYSAGAKAKQMLRNLAGRHGFPKGMSVTEMGKDEGGIPRFDKDPLASW
tara:strand:+ start:2077 stop:3132 length:1056 start_codon:yes stop_codon:yes gene_type:complete